MIRTRFLLTPLFLLMSTVSFARAEDGAVIYKRLLKSTVWVVNPVSQGSGVVIHQSTGGKTPFYLIATNHHVVDLPRSTTPDRTYPTVDVYHPRWNGGRLETDRKVYIRNGWKKRATIVHSDPKRDLAILYVSGKLDAPYSVVDISKDSATPGATVHSIGNPGSSAALWVYSDGKVRTSYKAAVRYKNGQLVNATFLVTTSPVNPGDSGGPLVDGNGRLVGINQGHQTNKRLMSYAIDRSELADYHKQLDNDGFFLAKKPEHFQNRIAYYRKVGRSAEALSNYSLLLKHYKTLHAKKPSSTLAKDIADVEKQIALLKRSPGSIP